MLAGKVEHVCHGYAGKVLDSAVMTTRAESILVVDLFGSLY
jgi:hypothetical protein